MLIELQCEGSTHQDAEHRDRPLHLPAPCFQSTGSRRFGGAGGWEQWERTGRRTDDCLHSGDLETLYKKGMVIYLFIWDWPWAFEKGQTVGKDHLSFFAMCELFCCRRPTTAWPLAVLTSVGIFSILLAVQFLFLCDFWVSFFKIRRQRYAQWGRGRDS